MLCRLRWQQWCIQAVDCDHEGNWNRSCKISIFFLVSHHLLAAVAGLLASAVFLLFWDTCLVLCLRILNLMCRLHYTWALFHMFFFWQLARSVWPRCILPSFDKAEKCCCIWYNHNKGGASVTVQGLNYLCISSHGHFFSTWSRRTRVIQPSRAKMEYLAVWNNNIQISPFE